MVDDLMVLQLAKGWKNHWPCDGNVSDGHQNFIMPSLELSGSIYCCMYCSYRCQVPGARLHQGCRYKLVSNEFKSMVLKMIKMVFKMLVANSKASMLVQHN